MNLPEIKLKYTLPVKSQQQQQQITKGLIECTKESKFNLHSHCNLLLSLFLSIFTHSSESCTRSHDGHLLHFTASSCLLRHSETVSFFLSFYLNRFLLSVPTQLVLLLLTFLSLSLSFDCFFLFHRLQRNIKWISSTLTNLFHFFSSLISIRNKNISLIQYTFSPAYKTISIQSLTTIVPSILFFLSSFLFLIISRWHLQSQPLTHCSPVNQWSSCPLRFTFSVKSMQQWTFFHFTVNWHLQLNKINKKKSLLSPDTICFFFYYLPHVFSFQFFFFNFQYKCYLPMTIQYVISVKMYFTNDSRENKKMMMNLWPNLFGWRN